MTEYLIIFFIPYVYDGISNQQLKTAGLRQAVFLQKTVCFLLRQFVTDDLTDVKSLL